MSSDTADLLILCVVVLWLIVSVVNLLFLVGWK